MSVSCFPLEPGPRSITVPALVQAKRMRREMDAGEGWEMSECGMAVEVTENCGHDCSNPVISPSKASHSSDLGTGMLSCLCPLPPRPISLSLASFIECQEVVLALPNSQFTVFTHTTGYLKFCQNKRGFSPAALELLTHLMHLNVAMVVQGQNVRENTALFIPKMETRFSFMSMINM